MSRDHELLAAGADQLGLVLAAPVIEKLLAYRDLLAKWNRHYNLTAVRDPHSMLTQHLLDALSLIPHLPGKSGRLLDVGSGGGIPGLPVAICCPRWRVDLIDSSSKKTAFQRQAIIELGLENAVALGGRVEDCSELVYPIVTSRAFASLQDFTAQTAALLAEGGRWLAMKGKQPDSEIADLEDDVVVEAVVPLHVPGLDAERCLVVLKRETGDIPGVPSASSAADEEA